MSSIYDNETLQFRLKYVLEVKDKDKSIAQAARDAGVDWKTMKSWVVRFDKDGIKGLLNKPRGRSDPVSDGIKKCIIDRKIENRSRSARKIRDILPDDEGVHLHRQTVWRVLKDAGENKRVKKPLKIYRDFERLHPNSLWQIDFMDAIVVEGIGLVYLILIVDDHSRKILGGHFVPDRTAYHALTLLWESIEGYGIPSQIYSDQGRQFKSHLGKGYTHFERICKRLGIGTIFGTVRYPEGRGKIERLFGFIQDDFIPEYRFTGLEDMDQKFQNWVEWYGEKHEHSSLGGNPPNSRYRDFTPRMLEGDFFEIFSEHFTRNVRKNATISFRGKIYPVDPRFIKEKVEVRAFGSDIKIYGQSQLLGEYDARIDYHEKMLRRVYSRVVRKDGTMKFLNVRYFIGREFAGQKVEIVVIRDQLRAFLSSNRMLIFKLGDSDAVLVRLDR
jgi:transposase InsO family protein